MSNGAGKGDRDRTTDHREYRRVVGMVFPRPKKTRVWRVYIEGFDQPLDWALTEKEADKLIESEKKKGVLCRKVKDL